MTNPRRINDTLVCDEKGGRRLVKPGDTIKLLPPPKHRIVSKIVLTKHIMSL